MDSNFRKYSNIYTNKENAVELSNLPYGTPLTFKGKHSQCNVNYKK